MAAPKEILRLVETFDRNIETYKTSHLYNEAQLRREFIDPFFEALGWDITNKQAFAPAYREVINEDAIKVGSATKAPDYCFRIGGSRKFFVEAKKPAADIKNDSEPAYQLRRYAWSVKLPLSILTNFEEFSVYDCLSRPEQSDKASSGRIMFLTYKDYPDNWDKIAEIFSKDAVLKGSFDKFVTSTKTKKGTTTVDIEFLKEIEKWRDMLAKNIALRNRNLTIPEINFAVQRIIDRIIFLRMCEDRGIEPYLQLKTISTGGQTYPRLYELFEKADTKYNSGLFHFRQEPGFNEPPDELTPNIVLDDVPLQWILHTLYYPQCPYEFSVFPPEILGNVYEQFLGKVIRLTPAHKVKIEEKPEVKKAGGVYYTPSYIVDYIVKNTVGKLVESKTPKEIEKIKILDPACGSGSFLVAAYTYLLNYIRDWYVQNNHQKYSKQIYQLRAGQYYLTIAEKKKILLNNIFGVDIDTQAVEVTKLSLLLKTLENENQDTLKLFRERALPDLANNIKCGNSLIGPDFFETIDPPQITDDLRQKINAFDWQKEFSQIFSRKNPGFDAVIGNPPYVLLQSLNQRPVFNYISQQYETSTYKIDTYHIFIEKGVKLTNQGGKIGYITPNTFLRNKHARVLRCFILKNTNVELLRVFYYPVFYGASVDTSIIILSRSNKPIFKQQIQVIRSNMLGEPLRIEVQIQKNWFVHPTQDFSLPGYSGFDDLATKFTKNSFSLGKFATAYFGIQTFDRKKYVKPSKEASHFKPVVDGVNIQRYFLVPGTEFVDFRKETIKSGGKKEVYERERIGVRQIGKVPVATMLPSGIYSLNTIYNIFFTKTTRYSLKYILALICSKGLGWFWMNFFFDHKETFPKVKKDALLSLPIRTIDFNNPDDVKKHDKMVKLVEIMLDLHKKLQESKIPDEKTRIQRQIDSTDRQIDRLVYDLYGLTDEEIKMIDPVR